MGAAAGERGVGVVSAASLLSQWKRALAETGKFHTTPHDSMPCVVRVPRSCLLVFRVTDFATNLLCDTEVVR